MKRRRKFETDSETNETFSLKFIIYTDYQMPCIVKTQKMEKTKPELSNSIWDFWILKRNLKKFLRHQILLLLLVLTVFSCYCNYFNLNYLLSSLFYNSVCCDLYCCCCCYSDVNSYSSYYLLPIYTNLISEYVVNCVLLNSAFAVIRHYFHLISVIINLGCSDGLNVLLVNNLVNRLQLIVFRFCSTPSYYYYLLFSSCIVYRRFSRKQQNFHLNKIHDTRFGCSSLSSSSSSFSPAKMFFSFLLCSPFVFASCANSIASNVFVNSASDDIAPNHSTTVTTNYYPIISIIRPTTPSTAANITGKIEAFITTTIDDLQPAQSPPPKLSAVTYSYGAAINQNSSIVLPRFSSGTITTKPQRSSNFSRFGAIPFLSLILSSKTVPISGVESFSTSKLPNSKFSPFITQKERNLSKRMQFVSNLSDKRDANFSSTLSVISRLRKKSATSTGHNRLISDSYETMQNDDGEAGGGGGDVNGADSDGVVIENDKEEGNEESDADNAAAAAGAAASEGVATGTEEDYSNNSRKKNTRDSNSKNNINIEDDEDYDADGESYASHISGSVFYNSNNNINNNVDNVDYVMHSPRTVNTKYGALQGIVITFVRYNDSSKSSSSSSTSSSSSSITLSPVEAFLGVPYASSPAGNLRFMPPVAPVHWRGVRQANHLAPVCPQRVPTLNTSDFTSSKSALPTSGGDLDESSSSSQSNRNTSNRYIDRLHRQLPYLRNQSEDCLYLNIYVPFEQYYKQRQQMQQQQQQQQKQRKKFDSSDSNKNYQSSKSNGSGSNVKRRQYPVIVFINGDSYDSGTGNSYDASVWSSYGQVIVVTLNYRLGVLGFLPAQVDGAVRGNYGLMDQVAALHWIQENIAEFGGNASNVTVIGHGFGASCLHLLMLSPMAKGLFTRAVLMSGSALAPSAIARDAENYARILAKELNCPIYDNVQLVDCLKRKSVDELLSIDLQPFRYLSAFGPIVDGIVVPYEPKIMMETIAYGGHYKSSLFNSPGSGGGGGGQQSGGATGSGNSGSHHQFNFNGDILFGVSRVEPPPATFSIHDEQFGIDVERRNRILRTLVRNLFDYHQQTIFWTLINEYTDWSRPSEHPINLLDSTVEILTDALVLGPLTESAELFFRSIQRHAEFTKGGTFTGSNSNHYSMRSPSLMNQFDYAYQDPNQDSSKHQSDNSRMFFYVFQNQNEDNNKRQSINQRLGSMHGEELDYLFGAPIADLVTGHSIGHFTSNLTRPNDLALSQAMINYFTNFAKFGNPNFDSDSSSSSSKKSSSPESSSSSNQLASSSSTNTNEQQQQLRARFEQLNWPSYSIGQRRYLLIGSKPRIRDHYNAHRLSFWLNLIPRLLMDQFIKRPESPNEVDDLLMDSFDDKDDIGLRYIRHHLLDNYDDSNTYEGQVRQITFGRLSQQQGSSRTKLSGGSLLRTSASSGSLFQMNADQSRNSNDSGFSFIGNIGGKSVKIKTNLNSGNIGGGVNNGGGTGIGNNSASGVGSQTGANGSGEDGSGNYSTALSVTIAIGCSLLILNMLIFTGVYYQLNRHAEKNRQRQQQEQQQLTHNANLLTHYHSGGGGVGGSASCNNSSMTRTNSSNQLYCPSSAGTMTTSNSISNNGNNANAMGMDNSNVVIDANHQTANNSNYLHYNGSLATADQQMLAIIGQLDVSGAMVVDDYGYSGQLKAASNSTSSSATAVPSHMHHVHYLDQDLSGAAASGGAGSTGTLQRQRHHHHHHHMMMLNPDGSAATSGDQTVSGVELDPTSQSAQQQQPLVDYYPLHSFNTTASTGSNSNAQSGTDESGTIYVNDPHRHHSHTPKASKTLRFSLSNEVVVDHQHSPLPQSQSQQINVPSSALTSFSNGDTTECGQQQSSALKRVKI